jgi:hypothetical protein
MLLPRLRFPRIARNDNLPEQVAFGSLDSGGPRPLGNDWLHELAYTPNPSFLMALVYQGLCGGRSRGKASHVPCDPPFLLLAVPPAVPGRAWH